ncbi:MAG: polysaccharide pyruvyl transferase family protein, partial [Thermodesulfobacteriota bacterium]
PQGSGDLEYFSEIIDDNKNFVVLERSMESFNKFLINDIDFDYIGTRLHGGIKCLLSKKRSIIIEVDNRAVEVAKDTNLPTIKRDNFKGVVDWINNPRPTDIKINVEEISLWKSQFLNKNAITI